MKFIYKIVHFLVRNYNLLLNKKKCVKIDFEYSYVFQYGDIIDNGIDKFRCLGNGWFCSCAKTKKTYNFFRFYNEDGLGFIKAFGFGIHWKDTTRHKLYFSERNGLDKYSIQVGTWRISILN